MRLCCCRPWKRRKSRAGRPPLHTFHPWIGDREKLSRFDLNCATLISVFRVVVVSAANLYPRARFKIRNSNGNTISRGSYKEKSNNFSQTRYRARARYGQRDFSIVYDNTTRFHILLRPISLFSPLSNGRNVACNDVTLIGRQPRGAEPSLHAIPTATRSSLSLPRQLFDPLELEFSGALTRKHVWKHVACVSIPLLHTSQGRVWRTYTRASVHIAERWTVPSRRSLESV